MKNNRKVTGVWMKQQQQMNRMRYNVSNQVIRRKFSIYSALKWQQYHDRNTTNPADCIFVSSSQTIKRGWNVTANVSNPCFFEAERVRIAKNIFVIWTEMSCLFNEILLSYQLRLGNKINFWNSKTMKSERDVVRELKERFRDKVRRMLLSKSAQQWGWKTR